MYTKFIRIQTSGKCIPGQLLFSIHRVILVFFLDFNFLTRLRLQKPLKPNRLIHEGSYCIYEGSLQCIQLFLRYFSFNQSSRVIYTFETKPLRSYLDYLTFCSTSTLPSFFLLPILSLIHHSVHILPYQQTLAPPLINHMTPTLSFPMTLFLFITTYSIVFLPHFLSRSHPAFSFTHAHYLITQCKANEKAKQKQ